LGAGGSLFGNTIVTSRPCVFKYDKIWYVSGLGVWVGGLGLRVGTTVVTFFVLEYNKIWYVSLLPYHSQAQK